MLIECSDLCLLIPLLLTSGAIAGILAGLLGVGGNIVIVSILKHIFVSFGVETSLAMPLAMRTDLSIIVVTSLASTRNHYAKGGLDMALVMPMLIGVLVGSPAPG